MCGKLCKCCKICKHCEEYETVDYEYLCPEPAFRCKAKNRDIWFVGLPRPFCDRFETKSESLNTFSSELKTLQDAYENMGSNAESISKILNSAIMSANEVRNLASVETTYKTVSDLHELEDCLELCPVCGEKPRLRKTDILTNDFQEQTIYQIGCMKRCGQVRSGYNLYSLIESWNRYAEDMTTRPTIKSKTTNCPNCGAPVDIHAEKCAYCDTPYIDSEPEYAQSLDGRRIYFK